MKGFKKIMTENKVVVQLGITNKWEVRRSGNMKASKTFLTKAEAEKYAEATARKLGAILVIKNINGKVGKTTKFN